MSPSKVKSKENLDVISLILHDKLCLLRQNTISISIIAGTLVSSCLATLDDGQPRRRDTISLFCGFLQPSGVLNHFHIPFHALTTSR